MNSQGRHEEHGVRVDLPGQRGAVDLQPKATEGEEAHDQQEGDGVDGRQPHRSSRITY